MLKKRILHWALAVVFIGAIVGCSDDESPSGPGNGGNGGEAPDFSVSQVTVPDAMAQSSDPRALQVVSLVNLANSFTNWFGFFTPPSSAAKVAAPSGHDDGPPWIHNWSDGNLTVTLTIDEQGDFYTWDVVVDGSDGENTYNDFNLAHAERAKDGSNGSMVINDPATSQVAAEWTWTLGANDVYSFLMTAYDATEDVQVALTVNPDQSGELEFRSNDGSGYMTEFASQWQSDGSGTWQEYTNGQISDSGSWM